MGGIVKRRVGWPGPVRNVGISPHPLRPVVTMRRMLLCTSSARKSPGFIQLPASRAAIFKPARASGSTATPAAAPNPPPATSTGFRLVAMVLLPAIRCVRRFVQRRHRLAHLLIVGGDQEPD